MFIQSSISTFYQADKESFIIQCELRGGKKETQVQSEISPKKKDVIKIMIA